MSKNKEMELSLTRALVTSLVSAFLFVVSLFFSMFIFGVMESAIGYGYNNFVMGISSLMLVLVLCGAALFGPAYYETRKFGWFEGLITLVISTLLAMGFITLVFMTIGGSGGGIRPLMEVL